MTAPRTTTTPTVSVKAQKNGASPRLPYPQLNSFRDFVTNELVYRKSNYPFPTSAPFVRLTSCQMDTEYSYAFFTLGLHGFGDTDLDVFDSTYGNGRDIVGYAYDTATTKNGSRKYAKKLIDASQISVANIPSDDAEKLTPEQLDTYKKTQSQIISTKNTVAVHGAHPIPGITSVQLQRGAFTPIICTVEWTCYNKAQLEFLRNHFLIAGGYVCLEWGQQFSDRQINKVLDFSDIDNVTEVLVKSVLDGRRYVINEWVEPNNGNYEFVVGTVGNFSVQLEAKTGIYRCMTTIYSTGEYPWSIDNHQTYTKTDVPVTSPEINRVTSIADFFREDGLFDKLISDNAGKVGVAFNTATWSNKTDNKLTQISDYKEFSSNPNDYRFISWDFLSDVIIPQMFALIDDPNVKPDLQRFINFRQSRTAVEEDSLMRDWLGNNQYLRSTRPDVMLLLQSNMATVTPAELQTAGYFDDFDKAMTKGKLSRGVWLNTGAIRDSFIQSNNFQASMAALLTKMNNAVQGYWQLQMFFDEETAIYKVIDNKYLDGKSTPFFYRFNSGNASGAPQGELIDVELDSAFPPELVMQMMMIAKYRTATRPQHDQMKTDFPKLGSTSAFMYGLNWTNLKDLVDQHIQRRRAGDSAAPSVEKMKATAQGTAPYMSQTITDRARVSSGFDPFATSIVSTLQSPAPDQRVGATAVEPINRAPVESPKVATRSSVTPPLSPQGEALKLRAKPFESLINASAAKYGVDPLLLTVLIDHESTFRPHARSEVGAIGLGQVMLDTARGKPGDENISPQELYNPAKNIDTSAWYLSQVLADHGGDVEAAVSSYNGGGGRRVSRDTYFCSAGLNRQNDTCGGVPRPSQPGLDAKPWVWVRQGEFGNQHYYVDPIMRKYNYLRQTAGQPPVSPQVGLPQNPLATRGTYNPAAPDAQLQLAEMQQLNSTIDSYVTRFGNNILQLIEPNASAMRNKVTRDGYDHYLNKNNAFVAPFPTTTKVTLTIQGIGGISVGDGFYVEKLPFIFEKYGCFAVTQLAESITSQGWISKITGYFKVIWLNGEGQ